MAPSNPPKWANDLLGWMLSEDLLEEVQGDLTEAFHQRLKKKGARHAKWKFILETIKATQLARPTFSDNKSLRLMLFKNHIKTGLRFLWKTRNTAYLNIMGLALGMTTAMMAYLFISDQFSYDRFHDNIDYIHRTIFEVEHNGELERSSGASYIMGEVFPEKIPGIINASRYKSDYSIIRQNQQNYYQRFVYADPDLFKMFDFEWAKGGPADFNDPTSVFLSQSQYTKFGKPEHLALNIASKDYTFRVAGVFEDFPINSTLNPQIIVPFLIYRSATKEQRLSEWFDINMNLLIQTDPTTDPDQFAAQMTKIVKDNLNEDDFQPTILLQPFSEIHTDTTLYSGNGLKATMNQEVLWVVGIVGVLCLFICGLNFSNFIMGSYLSRTREVGIRKSLGAKRNYIFHQFLTEAFISSVIGLILGVAMTVLLLPYFSEYVSIEYGVSDLFTLINSMGLIAILMTTTLLAGIYPAVVLSRLQANQAIKGINGLSGKHTMSKIFLTTQVSLSIFLIVGAIAMHLQLSHMLDLDLGYDDERLLTIDLPRSMRDKAPLLSKQLARISGISGFSIVSEYNGTSLVGAHEGIRIRHKRVDSSFFNLIRLKLHAGTTFTHGLQGFQNEVIINETLARKLGSGNLIGSLLPMDYGELKDPVIVGVVEDYHFFSPKYEQNPLVLYVAPVYPFQMAMIKMSSDYTFQNFEMIQKAWDNTFYPHPFDYSWVAEYNIQRMSSEENLGELSFLGAITSITLAILGLLGVLGTTIRQKMKEMCIRKVNGARPVNIYFLFVHKFSGWLGAGFIVGLIPAFYFLNEWLDNYAERIDVDWTIALSAVLICTVIFVGALTLQLIKVIFTNPVQYLRSE